MKLTRTQLAAHNEQLVSQNSLLAIALNLLARGEFITVGTHGDYTVKLAHPDHAHGGIVLVTFHPAGQSPYTIARYFEDWHRIWSGCGLSNSDDVLSLRTLAAKAKEIVDQGQRVAA